MRGSSHFIVGTDGSERAEIAFTLAMHEFLGKEDKVTVVSITDSLKTYLDAKYQPRSILLHYKNALLSNVA